MKKYYEENPEAREKQSEKIKKYYENNPESKEQMSKIKKIYYENPESIKKCSEAQKKRFENPEAREEMSKIQKKYYENNPEARRKSSKGQHNPFDVFTKDGIFIKTFSYQFEAKEYLQKEYNITSTFNISRVLSGSNKSSAGFVFKYK